MYSSPRTPSLAGKRRGSAVFLPLFAKQRGVGVSSMLLIIDI